MSLHQLAKHVQNQGRNGDTVLVHMTPSEVNGLQSLALAHGGSLSINPNTGLPEANFLKKILPIVTGAVGSYFGVSPAMTGLITGGVTGLASGNLQKGLMAGLGAYGGAALTGNIMAAGTRPEYAMLQSQAPELNLGDVEAQAGGFYGGKAPINKEAPALNLGDVEAQEGGYYGGAAPKEIPYKVPGSDKFSFDKLKQNFSLKDNLLPIGAVGASLLAPDDSSGSSSGSTTDSYIRPYSYRQVRNPKFGQPGEPYFIQSMTPGTPVLAREFGSRTYADGGLATLPDARLALNATYPQSGTVDRTQYATPYQMPTSAENLAASYEMATSPYSGEPIRMAEGGDTKAAVDQYNKMLSERAAMEYTRPEEFKQKYYAPPAPPAPTPAQDFGGGVSGLYQYYLGRQPTAAEIPQWSDRIKSTGMVTPEEAAYFRQYVGAEQAARGFTPTGPDPFSGQGMGGDPLGRFTYSPGFGYKENPNFVSPDNLIGGVPETDKDVLNKMIQQYRDQQIQASSGGAGGGLMPQDLGGYSDGGRLLKGPGDGVSDSIPAVIGNKQPARLADGEFVVPARIVSELGNGSTDAGARKLYGMMDRIQKKRRKSVKGKSFAIDSKADDALPA